ncbi:MAG TPA: shikimate kinase [Desulfuromonadales bacterium]|nr:shikimate kinase [Desulfuromonadales bacterium]
MNVVLIGYRGTGKSTVGRIVAERLGLRLVSMDSEIVKRAALSIPEFVEKYGWVKFRDLESDVAQELALQKDLVIDTGGGVIERQKNVDHLRRDADVFWLKASIHTITGRIRHDASRPALTSGKTFLEEVAEVLEKREPLYSAAAHHIVDTDDKAPGTIAEEIVTLWERNRGAV